MTTNALNPRFDNNIDFLRLLAAIAVVFGHAWAFAGISLDPLTQVFADHRIKYADSIHTLGVWFLFFISGKLVSASYAYRGHLGEFMWSRFLRIYPGLFTVVTVSVLGGMFLTTLPIGEYLSDKDTFKYFSRNILGLNIKYQLPGVFKENPLTAVNGSLWTIPLELRLYGVVALLGIIGCFKRLRILAVIGILLILVHVTCNQLGQFQGSRMFKNPVPVFLCGMLFFIFEKRIPKSLIGSVVLFIVWYFLREVPYAGHVLMVFSFCYGFFLLISIPMKSWLNVGKYGDYSYGVYLYSAPIQQLLVANGMGNGWTIFAFSLILSLLAGALSWHFIEKPALGFKSFFNKKSRLNAA